MADLRDEALLKKLKKLFEEGLNAAAKDPERMQQIERDKEHMVEPWEKAVKIWKKNVDEFKGKGKKATEDDYRALRAFKAAVQQQSSEAPSDLDDEDYL